MKPFCTLLTFILLTIFNLVTAQEPESEYLVNRQAAMHHITLLSNPNNLIPLKSLDTLRIATVSVGSGSITPFQMMLANYAPVDHFQIPAGCKDSAIRTIIPTLNKYKLVIAGVHTIMPEAIHAFNLLKGKYIMAVFTDPADFVQMPVINPSGLIMAFNNDVLHQELAAQMIFGGIGAHGKLASALGNYPAGAGMTIEQPIRLAYSVPEEVGMNSFTLTASIDSIIEDAIHQHAFPGCNLLIAKDGKVILQKAYGYHTYDNIIPSSRNDLYDLASMTKVSAALPAIMKLTDEGKINLDERFSTYWTDWQCGLFHRSNKEDLTMRELLAHQAGLVPFIKFWGMSQKDGKTIPRWYRVEEEEDYDLMVAPGMFLKDKFRKKVYRTIRLSPLKDRGKYVYSDLFFVMAPELISKVSGDRYLHFLDSCFYRPLGAGTVTYLPTKKFSIDRIVPTEKDDYYRKRLLQGSVHDEAAAVLGGISGNAGLFATANDLAKLYQMYLQYGFYGGERYISEETFREFNTVQFPQNKNRRALGFDKPLLNNATLSLKDSYPSPDVSPGSFGHSGYTGTFFWVDPEYNLVYILLTNRVYPTRNNNKLTELSIRTKVQQAIYDKMLHKGPSAQDD